MYSIVLQMLEACKHSLTVTPLQERVEGSDTAPLPCRVYSAGIQLTAHAMMVFMHPHTMYRMHYQRRLRVVQFGGAKSVK